VNPKDSTAVKIREIVFDIDDFFDKERIMQKSDRLIHAWGQELVIKGYANQIPISDDEWLKFLDMDIYWGDLQDEWEHYIVGCLIFFVMLRADIKRDFLLQPDYIRGQRLSRWLGKLSHYMNPLLRGVITKFCLCYSMISDKEPIKVRYGEITG